VANLSLASTTPAAKSQLVSTTPAANLPPVSMTPAEILPPVSLVLLILVAKRCPKKIMKIFLIEDFFHLPPVSMTLVVHLELRISPRILKNIQNSPNAVIRGLRETDLCGKPEVDKLVALSL
jgi:hypothetical protein